MTLKYDRFLIAPFQTGLENDIEPWLLPEDAFETLENAYVFRGRVHKRFGYNLFGDTSADEPQRFSRLRIDIGTTDGGGNLGATVVTGTVFAVGQMFSVGANLFTVNAAGAPAALLVKGTGTGTYDTTTGSVSISGSTAGTTVYFYPATPVMGLLRRELSTINQEETLAFDTQFAYRRSGGGWERVGANPTGAGVWTGSNSQFFWHTNFRGNAPSNTYFYVTNYNRADRIQYLPQASTTWTQLRPQLDSGVPPVRFLDSCRILIPFKDRLVALSTLETDGGNKAFPNRCRFTQNGDPTDPTTSWLDDTPGRGGFIDASTKEEIVSAEFIKDRLIVYFEASTWELVYTANEILPFRWQQINTELGCESTFSKVAFDKAVLAVGNVGIHACNGVNVERVDQKIPDEVFKIHNGNEGPERVYGIRDFYSELVYWTFPNQSSNPTFPNRILVYNYQNKTWAFNRETFTCFGYFQPDDDTSWATLPFETWATWTSPWSSGAFQSGFLELCAGNQEGFTFRMRRDKTTNAQAYQITDITVGAISSTLTVINHNFEVGDIFLSEEVGGTTFTNATFKVISVTDANTVVVDSPSTGTYTGGGTLRRLSGVDIRTKRYNPYISTGSSFYMAYIDFFVDKTTDGELSIDYFINNSDYSTATFGYNNDEFTGTGALLGQNILSTAPYALSSFETVQDKLWHRFYFGTEAFNLQMRIYLSEEQLKDTDISFSDIRLHGMILYTSQEGRLQ